MATIKCRILDKHQPKIISVYADMSMRSLMDVGSFSLEAEKLRSWVIRSFSTRSPFSLIDHWRTIPRGWTAASGIRVTVLIGRGIANPCSTSLEISSEIFSADSWADLWFPRFISFCNSLDFVSVSSSLSKT